LSSLFKTGLHVTEIGEFDLCYTFFSAMCSTFKKHSW